MNLPFITILCRRCKAEFSICKSCFRNHIYCSEYCKKISRKESRRKARLKFESSPDAKLDHCDRQKRYREKRRGVTDHTSNVKDKNVIDAPIKPIMLITASRCIVCNASLNIIYKGESVSDPIKELSSLGQSHLINSIQVLFNHEEERLRFFFDAKVPKLRVPTKILIEEAAKFALKDQITIRVAADFWNHRGAARLADMLNSWDGETWIHFILAVTKLLEIEQDLFEKIIDINAE